MGRGEMKSDETVTIAFSYPIPRVIRKGKRAVYVPEELLLEAFFRGSPYEGSVLFYLIFQTYGKGRNKAEISYETLGDWLSAWCESHTLPRGTRKEPLPKIIRNLRSRGIIKILNA